MTEKQEIFEVEHSYKSDYFNVAISLFSFSAAPIIIIIYVIIFSFLGKSSRVILNLILMGYGISFLMCFVSYRMLKFDLKADLPIDKIKFLISSEKIEIYLQNHLYQQILWKDIAKLEISKEKYLFKKTKYNYKLKFFINNQIKIIRLYCYRLKKKYLKLIIRSLIQFCQILNKELILIPKVERADYYETEKEIDAIAKFKKKKKAEIRSETGINKYLKNVLIIYIILLLLTIFAYYAGLIYLKYI
ncbi:MAG: hypothetical protein ACTSVV_07295 [Promethearchaeota archaeon]